MASLQAMWTSRQRVGTKRLNDLKPVAAFATVFAVVFVFVDWHGGLVSQISGRSAFANHVCDLTGYQTINQLYLDVAVVQITKSVIIQIVGHAARVLVIDGAGMGTRAACPTER